MNVDDTELRRPRPRAKKTLLIVLMIVCGVGLVCLVACGGCGYWLYKAFKSDYPAAQAAADAFLDDLQAQNVESAYQRTSRGFQTSQSLEQFRDYLKKLSNFTTHTSRTQGGFRVFSGTGSKHTTIQMTLHTGNNALTCTLVLIEEDGLWKVHRLSVP